MNLQLITNKEDLNKAHQIRHTVFVMEQDCPPEEEFDHLEETCTHFLLKDKEEAIGAARFRDYNGRGKLERICVLSDKRKTGAGKTIVLGIEEYAKQKGYKSFFLNSQVQAIPFYEKLGYEVCSDIFMDAGIPHKSMKKIFTK